MGSRMIFASNQFPLSFFGSDRIKSNKSNREKNQIFSSDSNDKFDMQMLGRGSEKFGSDQIGFLQLSYYPNTDLEFPWVFLS